MFQDAAGPSLWTDLLTDGTCASKSNVVQYKYINSPGNGKFILKSS